ncbi:MAG: protein kinase [Longimicrobiales bacterium]
MSDVALRLSDALADRYRIERELGQGGMATVYLAHDIRHDRQVALKVLKPELAAVLGADRFVQEIKTTAALQHPHILPLFDSGTADSFLFYVMPFIDGETLRSKLDRETQLGIDESVKITVAIADALDYAHRRGVIHRDIKPENILLHEGRPMVADFGIALAVSAAAGGRMTETGLSLGTPHYMSPEQATAEKEISARSDIYSLGSVLYEMLAGQPPHLGGSAQQIIMKIVTEEAAPVSKLRKSVPPNVAAAVSKALEKLPADRFTSAKEFSEALLNPAFAAGTSAVGNVPAMSSGRRVRVTATMVASAAILMLVGAGAARVFSAEEPPVSVSYRIALAQNDAQAWAHMAISPHGDLIAFRYRAVQPNQLWLKVPGRADATRIEGADRAKAPAFSNDARFIAFIANGRLRKAPVGGGDAYPIADSVTEESGAVAWRDDRTILFTGAKGELRQVGEDGGNPRVVVPRDSLPDHLVSIASVAGSRIALIITCSSNCARSHVFAVDVKTGSRTDLHVRGTRVWSLDNGLVAFIDAGKIFVAPFNPRTRSFTRPPAVMMENIETSGPQTWAALSTGGLVVFKPATGIPLFEPVWVTRDGNVTQAEPGRTVEGGGGFVLSADGDRLLTSVGDGGSRDVWMSNFATHSYTRVTFEGNASPVGWANDGSVLYYKAEVDPRELKQVSAKDASVATLATAPRDLHSVQELKDGTGWLMRLGPPPTRGVYLARRTAPDHDPEPLLANDRYEVVMPALSPDQQWIASATNESGRYEVVVNPFPNVKANRTHISEGGGASPAWAHSGKEMFYITSGRDFMSVALDVGTSVVPRTRRKLFTVPAGFYTNPVEFQFAVAPDDSRFLFLRRVNKPDELLDNTAVVIPDWAGQVAAKMKDRK